MGNCLVSWQLAVCSWQFASVIGKVRSAYNELGESQFCFKSASVPASLGYRSERGRSHYYIKMLFTTMRCSQ
ncbi:MAG: hypothetical protein EAZ28_25135 [Oscillatoriales cyanobacterium]|nr:MAG: hypothetical protein EAZ28_25135 [Oscillatoriales cyanobacterium]